MKETDTIIVRYSQELLKFLKDGECIGRLGGDNFVALILKERTSAFLELLSGVETYGMLGNRRISRRGWNRYEFPSISQENIWQIRICLRTLWIFCINMKWSADTLN